MLNLKSQKRIFKTLLIFFILGFFSISCANLGLNNQNINIKLDPEFPSANQSVTASTEIYITDMNRAIISWFVDGVLKLEGVGKKDFSFRTKDFGEVTNLTIQINSSDVGQVSKTFKIIPADLDLIWEADTFTPPFYKGKALNTHQAVVKIVAFPNFIKSNGVKINSEELIYTWKNDGKISSKDSGYGKSSFSFIGPELFRENIISVEVETLDGTIRSKKNILIKNYNPEIIFYEEDPLLGLLNNKNLEFFPLFNNYSEEVKIIAYPLFFSMYNKEDIQYDWFVSNDPAQGFENKITIRREIETTGSFPITLKIQDLKKFLLFTENSFNLIFE